MLKLFQKFRNFKRRHLACRLLFYTIIGALAVLLGVNIWLSSSLGKKYLAKKMRAKTGLHYEMNSAFWIPGFGLRLGKLKVFMAKSESLLSEMDQLQVKVDWLALLQAKVEVSNVVAVKPKFEVTEEQAIAFLKKLKASVEPKPKPVPLALNSKKQSSKKSSSQKVEPDPASENSPKPPPKNNSNKKPTAPKPRRTVDIQPPTISKPKKKKDFLQFIELRQASFVISSSEKQSHLEIEEVDLKLPMNEKTEGFLKVGIVNVMGESIVKGFSSELKTIENGVSIIAEEQDLGKMSCNGEVKLDKFGNFALSGKFLLRPEVNILKGHSWGEVEFDHVRLEGLLKGNIRYPHLWNGVGRFSSDYIGMIHPAKSVKFDETDVRWILAQSQIQVGQIHCDSAELKIRGYASLASNGDSSAVIRVITTEDEKENVKRFFAGIRLGFPMKHFPLTEDIFYNDVYLNGKAWNPEIKTGKLWFQLKDRLKLTKKFLEIESQEEQKALSE